MIPTVETERLVLSGPTLDDLDDSLAMWSDPQTTRYVGGVALTEEDVWARIMRYVGHWHLRGFGSWIVRDRAGRYVGEVGLLDYRRAVTPPLDIPEVGWALARSAQGKGYATEAVRAALAWGRTKFQAFSCMIDPENAPSLRVAQRCGFREVARTTYKGAPTIILRA